MPICDCKDKVWIEKISDIILPILGEDGRPGIHVGYFDLNFFTCKACGNVTAEVD